MKRDTMRMYRQFRDDCVHALRTTTRTPVRGYMWGRDGVCALGLIALDVLAIEPPHQIDPKGLSRVEFRAAVDEYDRKLDRVGAAFRTVGLPARTIARRFDAGASFADIADWLDTFPVVDDTVPDTVPAEWLVEFGV